MKKIYYSHKCFKFDSIWRPIIKTINRVCKVEAQGEVTYEVFTRIKDHDFIFFNMRRNLKSSLNE